MIQHACVRTEIMEIVSSIIPFDQEEQKHIDFVKEWMASGVEIFRIAKPDKPKIHLVSYFVLVDPYTNELLLTDHKKSSLWLPSGGHVEKDEHPKQTVSREAKEELGIEAEFLFDSPQFITVTNTVGNVTPHTDVSLWYVLRGNRNIALQFDCNEFHRIQWFLSKEIPYDRSDPHMRRFVDKVEKKITTLNSYDATVAEYAENTVNLHPSKEAAKFIASLPAHASILDVGCGPGRDANVFASHGFDVTGIDFSSKMIALAKQNAPLCTFYVMDIENLSFPSDSFDGIWASCALLHVPKRNLHTVLERFHTILKTKGSLYLSVKQSHLQETFEKDSRYGGFEKYWSFFQREELVQLLRQANFTVQDEVVSEIMTHYQTHPIIKIFAHKT